MRDLPRKIAIIGAGPSGLFMAKQLREIAQLRSQPIAITIFEKESTVGGKCKTYQDKNFPLLKAELGAGAVAPNYGLVLRAMQEYGVAFETMLPVDPQSVPIEKLFLSLPLKGKPFFIATLLRELAIFEKSYQIYLHAKQTKAELPEELTGSFARFAAIKHLNLLPILLKPLVAGFGYGDLIDCPTYSILEYMGHTTLLDLVIGDAVLRHPPLLAVHNGFQTLMERMSEEFLVKLNSDIYRIMRDSHGVRIFYYQNGTKKCEVFDSLVLAVSPKQWPLLNLDLTALEKLCTQQISYYQYPVLVCKLHGYPAKQMFFPSALEKSHFGNIALITTRDNRANPPDGRLCVVYINQPPKVANFDLDQAWPNIVEELKSLAGATMVTFISAKIWDDYLPTLPWNIRLELDAAQFSNTERTIYTGAYTLGAFEDVVSVANCATNLANQLFNPHYYAEENLKVNNVKSTWQFFAEKPYAPVTEDGFPAPKGNSCTIL